MNPGADCNSDHILLTVKLKCKLKNIKQKEHKPRLDIQLLNSNQEIVKEIQIEVRSHFQKLTDEAENIDVEEAKVEWSNLEKT